MKLTIGKKMLGGFLSVSLLLGIISFISYYNIKKVDESYSDLVERRVIILSNAKDMQISASRTNFRYARGVDARRRFIGDSSNRY